MPPWTGATKGIVKGTQLCNHHILPKSQVLISRVIYNRIRTHNLWWVAVTLHVPAVQGHGLQPAGQFLVCLHDQRSQVLHKAAILLVEEGGGQAEIPHTACTTNPGHQRVNIGRKGNDFQCTCGHTPPRLRAGQS